MDSKEFNRKLDNDLANRGVVDKSLFLQFCDAYSYDAATSVSWLNTKLRILRDRLVAGKTLSIYELEHDSQTEMDNKNQYLAWVKKHFHGLNLK